MGICRSSANQFNEKEQYNVIKAPKECMDYDEKPHGHDPLVYHNLSRDSVITNHSNQAEKAIKSNTPSKHHLIEPIENKIRPPKWTKLSSVPVLKTISDAITINDHEILIIPAKIEKDIDLVEIPTYLYKYNLITNKYSKSSQYPHDFPKGTHTSCLDRDNGILYMFIEKGYISNYNISGNTWKWDIIHGVNNWKYTASLNESCSVMVDNQFHLISGQQHLVWNKNTKQLKLAQKLDVWNYAKIIYRKNKGTLLLIGGNDAINEQCGNYRTLDTMYSYSLKYNHWMKLKSKWPFGVSTFGYMMTMEERYILIFGGKQLPFNEVYDGIMIMDLNDFSVRRSEIKCPIEGGVIVCGTIDYKQRDLIIKGLIRECWESEMFEDVRCLSEDIVGSLSMFYCVENVHLFNRDGNGHWIINVDCILK